MLIYLNIPVLATHLIIYIFSTCWHLPNILPTISGLYGQISLDFLHSQNTHTASLHFINLAQMCDITDYFLIVL